MHPYCFAQVIPTVKWATIRKLMKMDAKSEFDSLIHQHIQLINRQHQNVFQQVPWDPGGQWEHKEGYKKVSRKPPERETSPEESADWKEQRPRNKHLRCARYQRSTMVRIFHIYMNLSVMRADTTHEIEFIRPA